LAGLAVIYLLGLLRLQAVLNFTWGKTLTVGFLPFILPDLAKAAAAVAVRRMLERAGLLPS